MNEHTNLVVNALEYYDMNNEKYSHLYKNTAYYSLVYTNIDMGKNTILLYDNDKNLLIKSAYEIIGLYSNTTSVWAWAWAIPYFYKNSTYISKKIINYGIDLDPDQITLKTELITSRFRISNPTQIDIHVAVTSYLSKNPVVFSFLLDEEESHKHYSGFIKINNNSNEKGIIYYLFLLDYEKYI